LRKEILKKVYIDIEHESQCLCSGKNPSMFRKCSSEDLVNFSERDCEIEMKVKAPTLFGCMLAATVSAKTKKKVESGRAKCNTAPAITMAASVLLKRRCPQMSAQAYRFSLGVLWHSGAKKQVLYINIKTN
jgi:hypothetical protein